MSVTTVHNGTKLHSVITLDENGSSDTTTVTVTGEESGTTIQFAVPEYDGAGISRSLWNQYMVYADPATITTHMDGFYRGHGRVGGKIGKETFTHNQLTVVPRRKEFADASCNGSGVTILTPGNVPYRYAYTSGQLIADIEDRDRDTFEFFTVLTGDVFGDCHEIIVRMNDLTAKEITPGRERIRETQDMDKKIVDSVVSAMKSYIRDATAPLSEAETTGEWVDNFITIAEKDWALASTIFSIFGASIVPVDDNGNYHNVDMCAVTGEKFRSVWDKGGLFRPCITVSSDNDDTWQKDQLIHFLRNCDQGRKNFMYVSGVTDIPMKDGDKEYEYGKCVSTLYGSGLVREFISPGKVNDMSQSLTIYMKNRETMDIARDADIAACHATMIPRLDDNVILGDGTPSWRATILPKNIAKQCRDQQEEDTPVPTFQAFCSLFGLTPVTGAQVRQTVMEKAREYTLCTMPESGKPVYVYIGGKTHECMNMRDAMDVLEIHRKDTGMSGKRFFVFSSETGDVPWHVKQAWRVVNNIDENVAVVYSPYSTHIEQYLINTIRGLSIAYPLSLIHI